MFTKYLHRKLSWCLWFVRYIAQLYIGTNTQDQGGVRAENTTLLKHLPDNLSFMVPQTGSENKIYYVFPYSSESGLVQELIHNAKFYGSVQAQWICAKILLYGIWQVCNVQSADIPSGVPIIIVPVPSSPKNVRSRGYDQCQAILSILNDTLNIKSVSSTSAPVYICSILRKRRFVTEQKKQNLQSRLASKNPLYVRSGKFSDEFLEIVRSFSGLCRVCVIDDVVTTGITIENARSCAQRFLKEKLCAEQFELISFQAVAIAHEL